MDRLRDFWQESSRVEAWLVVESTRTKTCYYVARNTADVQVYIFIGRIIKCAWQNEEILLYVAWILAIRGQTSLTSKRGQPLYKGQKDGSQVCPLFKSS